MSEAVERIESCRRSLLAIVAERWAGLEPLLVIELVRSLDYSAFALNIVPNAVSNAESEHTLKLLGAGTALAGLMETMRNSRSGVPWGPSEPSFAALADSILIECGKLSAVHRLASLERYGLATTSFPSADRLVIQVDDGGTETAEREEGGWLSAQQRLRHVELENRMTSMKGYIGGRIGRYVYAADDWFIGYDPDPETFQYHLDLAKIYSSGTAELDSLPHGSSLAGRTFEEWSDIAVQAYGKVLHHIACATKLLSQKPQIDLRNLLTIFARKDDIEDVWGGGASGRQVMDMLNLDADGVARLNQHYEVPVPYYIDFGQDFVLLPTFGGLMNPVSGLTNRLRHDHRTDWDRALDGREAAFRGDIIDLLGEGRYFVPRRGASLKKSDGSDLTDIDAVIVDRFSGDLCLVQLKWPDIYGRSLTER